MGLPGQRSSVLLGCEAASALATSLRLLLKLGAPGAPAWEALSTGSGTPLLLWRVPPRLVSILAPAAVQTRGSRDSTRLLVPGRCGLWSLLPSRAEGRGALPSTVMRVPGRHGTRVCPHRRLRPVARHAHTLPVLCPQTASWRL